MIGRTNAIIGGGAAGGGLDLTVKAYSTLPASGKENEIAVITSTTMTNYFIAVEDLYGGTADRLAGVATESGYLSSSGGNSSADATRKEVRTVSTIPVEYGKSYTIKYTLASSKAMRLLINEYKGTSHKQRISAVDNVTGTSQTYTYTPSESGVTAIRIAWATYGLDCSVTMPYEITTAPEGTVWIQLGNASAAPIWVDKNKTLQIHPMSAVQCINGEWTSVPAQCYQNGEWVLWVSIYYDHGKEPVLWTLSYPEMMKKNADCISVYWNCSGAGATYAYSEKVDLTNISTLYIEYTKTGARTRFSVTDTVKDSLDTNLLTYVDLQNVTNGVASLDVSTIEGEHYVEVAGILWAAGTIDHKIYEVWGET